MDADDPLLSSPHPFFEEAPCGLIVTTEDGTILTSNRTFSTWIGLSQVELKGRRFQDLLTMGGRIFHQTHWAPLMRMQGSVGEVKLEVIHRDRSTITMLLNGVRREYRGGVHYELALFGTTDRDKYERELLNARKLAEGLLKEKNAAEIALQHAQAELEKAYEKAKLRAEFAEQMVTIVSHDLKNPLTATIMATGMLAKGERTAKERLLLGHITQSAERAQRMIADLLDFALAREGRGIAISPSMVDPHTLVHLSVEELRVAFPDVTLLHQCFGECGTVNLDADRIQQVIGNLVANSVTYGDSLQAITVSSNIEPTCLTIAVHNHGAPIADSQAASLFEPMARGIDAPHDVKSVGLGLFIVKAIALAHGGDVSVSSSVTDGTTFRVRIPLS